jgi:Meiotically up-regulated gene 113
MQDDSRSAPATDHCYLMYNARNGYTKIGRSFEPAFRESTLQSEEPEVYLVAIAVDHGEYERELHEGYARYRLRGEWFNLSPYDLISTIVVYDFRVVRLPPCVPWQAIHAEGDSN